MAELFIRQETTKDYRQVETVIKEAFDGVYAPKANEHLLVYRLRKTESYISKLSFVAEKDNKIVGYITVSKGQIKDQSNETLQETLILGPLAVLPNYQKQGIGTRLMEEVIKEARFLEYQHIFVFGNPKYYSKFGFENAIRVNCSTREKKNFPEFMVLQLRKDCLEGISGSVWESEIFHSITDEEVEKFNVLLEKAIRIPREINKKAANINTIFLWIMLALAAAFLIIGSFDFMDAKVNRGVFLLAISGSIMGIGNARYIGGRKKSAILAYVLAVACLGIGIYMFL